MTGKVALVTGANRGLGLGVCRQLARAGMRVIPTCRDVASGARAAADLRSSSAEVTFERLDVSDDASVAALASDLSARAERLDVLVNNAGISMKGFDANVAARTTDVNFRGAMRVTDALEPLLVDGARVVMVSSGMGEVSSVSPALQKRFLDPAIDRAQLLQLVDEFVRDVGEGRHEAAGWPSSAYRVSKIAMNSLTRILARELAPRRILVNAVCPGWVRTDMSGPSASRSVEEGARSIVWATMLEDGGPTGGFFRDGQPVSW